jgi:hypothetical protein
MHVNQEEWLTFAAYVRRVDSPLKEFASHGGPCG